MEKTSRNLFIVYIVIIGLILILMASSCVNLKPISKSNVSHYTYRDKHATYYATRTKCYTVIIDTVKK